MKRIVLAITLAFALAFTASAPANACIPEDPGISFC